MHVDLSPLYRGNPDADEAREIIRSCVHCGFCLATCPTYQLLGDERDSPRGRIYLIKQVLEANKSLVGAQLHLDRCLSCRSCETTCPSGVRYGRLADIGRRLVAARVKRPWLDTLQRQLIGAVMPYPSRLLTLMRLAWAVRRFLPGRLRAIVPLQSPGEDWPAPKHSRRMLVLDGCVQSVLAGSINAAAARVLAGFGISLLASPNAGCCGAISYHLTDEEEAMGFIRRNIDAWIPYLDHGCEAIISTASGCGLMVREYGEIMRRDSAYRDKAARIASACRDLAEVVDQESAAKTYAPISRKLAFQNPCTLQHGQNLNGLVERVLRHFGFDLAKVADGHFCCGSAGTYSLLQPELAYRLRQQKLLLLEADEPDAIVSANIGCMVHLQAVSNKPITHWIEEVDRSLN